MAVKIRAKMISHKYSSSEVSTESFSTREFENICKCWIWVDFSTPIYLKFFIIHSHSTYCVFNCTLPCILITYNTMFRIKNYLYLFWDSNKSGVKVFSDTSGREGYQMKTSSVRYWKMTVHTNFELISQNYIWSWRC